jgi:septum formation protein
VSDDDLRAYVATAEPMGKAGAYAVQGRAAAYISHIQGSYTGIMGLPLFETAHLLRSLNSTPCNKKF